MYKRKRYPSSLLTWLVICTQILALVSTATVGAIQPTPQMAQEAAQQAGFGDWFANATARLTAAGQRLWGAPATAAAQTTGPGGVTSSLETWVKANAGAGSTDGAAVATWSDQSGNGYNFTQATAAAQPTYYSTTASKLLNFNPVVDFDGTNDFLRNATVLMPSSSAYTYLAVGADEDTATGYRKLFGAEYFVDYFGLYKQGGATNDNGWIPYAVGGQARSAPFIGDRGSMGKGTKYSAAGGANGFWNGTNFTSNSSTDHIQPQIVGYMSLNSATTDPFYTWVDGYKEDPNWSPIVDGLVFRDQFHKQVAIGADVHFDGANYEHWKGRIPEFVVYNRQLNDTEMAQVNTYLAIKYGVTLGQGNGAVYSNNLNYSYIASDGTTVIWDATANTTYKYDIAGIGRDDTSGLTQKQAQSVNGAFQPVIGLGTIAATNAANAGSFGVDKNFLVWGNDGASASFATAYAPNSFTPPSGYFRLTRVWKVQETGAVGSVQVRGPASADHLLVSSDATFASGVTEIAMTTDGSGNMVAAVDFANGQFFTFGAALTAPGGVVNGLRFWVRGDKSVYSDAGSTAATSGSSVQQWSDQSLNGFDVSQATAGQKPTYQAGTSQSNFNAYLEFNDDLLTNFSQPSPRVMAATDDLTMIGVGWKSTTVGIDTIIELENNSPTLDVTNLDFNPWADGSGPAFVTHVGGPVVQNRMHIFDMRAPYNVNDALVAGLNGYDHSNSMELAPDSVRGADIDIGSDSGGATGGGEDWDGGIVEGIVYNRTLASTELAQVRSYLAIRNGVTLDINPTNAAAGQNYDYLNSSSTVIWAGNSTNSGYHNDVAGIGRDDASALDQKQAKSVNSGALVTMGLGAIAADNASNPNTFAADKSFLVWGNDTGSTSFGTPYTPDSFVPPTPFYRMSRIWKVQETGTVGAVQVAVNAGADYLIVDTDGDGNFATGTQQEIALNGGGFPFDFATGHYFTFGRAAIAPGGVAPNLVTWFKADAGVTTSGSDITSWSDSAGAVARTADQPTVSQRPDLLANGMNFNPSASFNGVSTVGDKLRLSNQTGYPLGAAPRANYIVASKGPQQGDYYITFSYGQEGSCLGWNVGAATVLNAHWDAWACGFQTQGPTPPFWPVGEPVLAGATYGPGILQAMYRNGILAGTRSVETLNTQFGTDTGYIGERTGPAPDNEWDGEIAEIILYDGLLSATEEAQVESYLALKYGITLGSAASPVDYLASDSATIWDGNGANSAYHNDVAGIGRDDASALNQKQSKSVNTGTQVTIGLGGIAATNAANANTFTADKSYEVWGDNGGATTLSANYNGGTNNRLARVWRVQETGTVGTVKVQLPTATAAGLQSIIVHATSSSFATVDRTYALTVNGSNYEATVDFNNGDYFSFSTTAVTPDLTTSIGQPSPAFVAGSASNVPLTVSNIGSGPTTGTVTASMTLPTGTSAPASFTSNGWSCTTVGQTVTCTSAAVIAAGGSSPIQVPVTPNASTVGTQPVFNGASSTPGETNTGNNAAAPMTPSVAVAAAGVTLPVKVLLQGAYDTVSGLMRDQLRSLASFPLTSPYGDGAVIAASSVLTANNIVDWVRIELRGTGALSTTVVASQGALLQRDGDVVGVDGVSTLSFTGLSGNSYHVVVKHRNHLGVMTAGPVTLSASTPVVDFTAPTTAVFVRTRTVAQKAQSGKMLMWGGDANGDGDVKGAGPGTDPGAVRIAVLGAPGNSNFAANYVAVGYAKADVTMNGSTIGAGSGNEISNVILPNVLSHPGNPTLQNNYIICQQLPEDPCN